MFDPYKPWDDITEVCRPQSTQHIGPLLFALACLTGARTTAEVGVYKGFVSMGLLAAVARFEDGVHHAIDRKGEHLEHLAGLAQQNGMADHLRIHQGNSADMDLEIEIDLLHIDGNHSYEAVTADIRMWVPKIKPGGYVCFHDYFITKYRERVLGVGRAVDEALTDEFEHILLDYTAGSMLWRRKA